MARAGKLAVEGSIFIPCLLLLSVGITASIGVWILMRKWSQLTYHQLRINRCVGQVALEFRDRIIELEGLNVRVSALRGSIRAARIVPFLVPTVPALEAALWVSVGQQDLLLLRWRVTQARWVLPGHCGSVQDRGRRLPSLEFTRGIPDDAGPQALEWEGEVPDEFLFQLRHASRAAAAVVEKVSESRKWRARWSIPLLHPGADFF